MGSSPREFQRGAARKTAPFVLFVALVVLRRPFLSLLSLVPQDSLLSPTTSILGAPPSNHKINNSAHTSLSIPFIY